MSRCELVIKSMGEHPLKMIRVIDRQHLMCTLEGVIFQVPEDHMVSAIIAALEHIETHHGSGIPTCLGPDMDCGRPLPCPDHPGYTYDAYDPRDRTHGAEFEAYDRG